MHTNLISVRYITTFFNSFFFSQCLFFFYYDEWQHGRVAFWEVIDLRCNSSLTITSFSRFTLLLFSLYGLVHILVLLQYLCFIIFFFSQYTVNLNKLFLSASCSTFLYNGQDGKVIFFFDQFFQVLPSGRTDSDS